MLSPLDVYKRQIQNNAPGPPAHIAVATPTMLPVPIVAERAVHKAPKEVTSPSPPSSFFTIYFKAKGSLRIWVNPNLKVKNIPPAIIKTIKGVPHTKSLILTRSSVKLSNILKHLSNKEQKIKKEPNKHIWL